MFLSIFDLSWPTQGSEARSATNLSQVLSTRNRVIQVTRVTPEPGTAACHILGALVGTNLGPSRGGAINEFEFFPPAVDTTCS